MPTAARELQGDRASDQATGIDMIIASGRVDHQPVARLGMKDRRLGREAVNDDLAAVGGDRDRVTYGAANDRDRVSRTVSGRSTDRSSKVQDDSLHVRAGEIADSDVVHPARSVELDGFDFVQVHDD